MNGGGLFIHVIVSIVMGIIISLIDVAAQYGVNFLTM